MTFEETLVHAREMLEREGRVAYRILKRRLDLDDDDVEDLKADLIEAKRVAIDEEGKVLVWIGGAVQPTAPQIPDSGLRTRDAIPPEAGRRQLTVMFCDLVGSTALSAQLDPEDLRDVVRLYQEASAEVIGRFGGYIAQYLGDGLLVYFGYPVAHEDDAQRAVRAGLAIVEAIHTLSLLKTRLRHPLQVRVGIHTGLVVVGEIGGGSKREQLALGETPNVAARVQGLAEADTIVISTATYHLVQGFFACRNLGPFELKGISIPVGVYQILSESSVQSRFDVAVATGLTPLVGREQEFGLLLERWARTKAEAGQVVLLSGEPGIGKSRLVQAVKERVTVEGANRIEFRCSSYYQNSALYPVIEHLQRLLQFDRADSPQVKLEKLTQALTRYHFPQATTLPLLAALLSLPHPAGCPPLMLSPQKQKEKTQEALIAWLGEEAERTAVYVAWEDLQWADPSSVELIGLLIDRAPTMRMLVLLTYRPEFTPAWAGRAHLTPLTLPRLPRSQGTVMVEKLTGGKALPPEVVQQIVAKTDGVPLFVEELTKMVLESGLVRAQNGHYELTGPLPALAIPATLQDSLMARLDRLSSVREVAQLGATLGREFSYELLRAISPLEEVALQRELGQLVEAELLYQHGLAPQARYIFKHALIQDTAYQSLLKSRRLQLHQRVAQVLEERFPETKETQPELLAHHYTEAGLIGQALPYWQQAGQTAVQRSAHIEAICHFTKALELLQAVPDTPERLQQELTLQMALGAPLLATRGYAAPEMERAHARARDFCRQIGDTSQLFPALFGLWVFYFVQGALPTARELIEECFSLAQNTQDSALLVEAHAAFACTLFYQGELPLALAHVEHCLALYDPQQHGSHIFQYGQDPAVVSEAYAASTLWQLGYPDQALKRTHKAFSLAEELAHPFSLAFALSFATGVHQWRQEAQLTQERAEALIALSNEQGFPFWVAWGTILRGWALAEQGQVEEGIVQIRQGMAGERAIGAELGRPYQLALLAETYGKTGQRAEEGLTTLAEALDLAQRNGERNYEGELQRLKGQLTLQSQSSLRQVKTSQDKSEDTDPQSLLPDPQSEAEACFLKAIEIAHKQQAKSLELRAATSLARLWQRQGRREEARQMLTEIYGWFTEGLDTKDLQEAKALLEELN